MVLAAFLAAAGVTTQLLALARAEGEEARRRAAEIASLSRLGSETLNAPRPSDALGAIAQVVHSTLDVAACEIFEWNATDERITTLASAGAPVDEPATRAAAILTAARQGAVVIVRPGGNTERIALDSDDIESSDAITRAVALTVPLRAHTQTVGVLCIDWGRPADLRPSERRFLAVLSYYAALGVDRALLATEAAHVEALREADRLKDMLLASVSHDLRTPLTTIRALAQRLALQGDTTASVIEEQVDRLSRFVGDILDLSRMKSGHFPLQTELNTAEDVIGAVARHTSGLMRGIRLETNVDLGEPALVGRFDFTHTLRVLTNLIENAVRFTPAGRRGRARRRARRRGLASLRWPIAGRASLRVTAGSSSSRSIVQAEPAPMLGARASASRSRAAWPKPRAAHWSTRNVSGGGSTFTLRVPAAEIGEVPASANEPL